MSARRLRGCLGTASGTAGVAGDAEPSALDLQRGAQARPNPRGRWCLTVDSRLPHWLQQGLLAESTVPTRQGETNGAHARSDAQHTVTSNERRPGLYKVVHHGAACNPPLCALAGAAAGLLPATAGECAAAISASGTVGGSMVRAALRLPGPLSCRGAVWVCAAAECALCSNLPPYALNGVRHESSSINYARESMLPKFVVFQLQLLGVNGLF